MPYTVAPRTRGFFMIKSVSPVPAFCIPSARIFPVLTSRTVMRAPPTCSPITLASRAIARIITLVSFPPVCAKRPGKRIPAIR